MQLKIPPQDIFSSEPYKDQYERIGAAVGKAEVKAYDFLFSFAGAYMLISAVEHEGVDGSF
jgi:hypothetical protein